MPSLNISFLKNILTLNSLTGSLVDWFHSLNGQPPLTASTHPQPNLSTFRIQDAHISDLINARYIRNKVIDFLTSNNLDLLVITKTLLSSLDAPITTALNQQPFSFQHLPRNSSNLGDGIGIICKSTLSISKLIDRIFSHSEAFTCSVSRLLQIDYIEYLYILSSPYMWSRSLNMWI